MKRFDECMKHFSDVEGWFQTPAIAIWDSLLSYQQERQISGNLLEIGVWKGKSAALAALHCQSDDACVFVDAMPLDEAKARISRVRPDVTCHYLQEQSQFLARHPFVAQGTRGFRWIHVDGEHSGQSVINDLEIADHLLSDRGMAVFDDFFHRAIHKSPKQFSSRPSRGTLNLALQALVKSARGGRLAGQAGYFRSVFIQIQSVVVQRTHSRARKRAVGKTASKYLRAG